MRLTTDFFSYPFSIGAACARVGCLPRADARFVVDIVGGSNIRPTAHIEFQCLRKICVLLAGMFPDRGELLVRAVGPRLPKVMGNPSSLDDAPNAQSLGRRPLGREPVRVMPEISPPILAECHQADYVSFRAANGTAPDVVVFFHPGVRETIATQHEYRGSLEALRRHAAGASAPHHRVRRGATPSSRRTLRGAPASEGAAARKGRHGPEPVRFASIRRQLLRQAGWRRTTGCGCRPNAARRVVSLGVCCVLKVPAVRSASSFSLLVSYMPYWPPRRQLLLSCASSCTRLLVRSAEPSYQQPCREALGAPRRSRAAALPTTGTEFEICSRTPSPRAHKSHKSCTSPPTGFATYFLAMLAGEDRNMKCGEAIKRCIAQFQKQQGRAPLVLDLGCGTAY